MAPPACVLLRRERRGRAPAALRTISKKPAPDARPRRTASALPPPVSVNCGSGTAPSRRTAARRAASRRSWRARARTSPCPGNAFCGGTWNSRTSRSGSSNGSGRSSTALTMLKMAVLAPMPSASTADDGERERRARERARGALADIGNERAHEWSLLAAVGPAARRRSGRRSRKAAEGLAPEPAARGAPVNSRIEWRTPPRDRRATKSRHAGGSRRDSSHTASRGGPCTHFASSRPSRPSAMERNAL